MEGMSGDDLDDYEAEMELQLYREYRDVVGLFRYVVETERRFYLANEVTVTPHADGSDLYVEVQLVLVGGEVAGHADRRQVQHGLLGLGDDGLGRLLVAVG